MDKKNVLLKISGESLSGLENNCNDCEPEKNDCHGYKEEALNFIGEEIVSISHTHELSIVVGGGNLIRGRKLKEEIFARDTVVADYMGMLATVINGIALQEFLEKNFGLKTRVLSAIRMNEICEEFIVRKAKDHLEKGRINLFVGGTGNPDFTTDTAMILRAHEVEAKTVLKGTKVDGIYDKDPDLDKDAVFIPEISYMDFLNRGLKIIDSTAVTQAMNHGIEIRIFNFFVKGNLKRALVDKDVGSVIH